MSPRAAIALLFALACGRSERAPATVIAPPPIVRAGPLEDRFMVTGELAAADPRVSVVHRTEKAGLGAAYLYGFAVALERGYDAVGEMDADGSHQPEQLPRLLDALADADLVIGSRWVAGGAVVVCASAIGAASRQAAAATIRNRFI